MVTINYTIKKVYQRQITEEDFKAMTESGKSSEFIEDDLPGLVEGTDLKLYEKIMTASTGEITTTLLHKTQ